MRRAGAPSKYGPLYTRLRALPDGQTEVTLTFAEMEMLIGGPLPPSAGTPDYWATSYTAARYWKAAGFRAELQRHARRVLFTRQGG
jgi:hypothetical protein